MQPKAPREPRRRSFPEAVGQGERRKLRSRRSGQRGPWFGMGMFGLVGWSVAVPTVVGIFIGLWIDAARPGRWSWTLMLLGLGLIVGGVNAWYWIQRERSEINRERENRHDEAA
ncbi:MAG: AtpZ/AtpI family protein [Desulfobacteraceae bacterium]|nr:AtpZ/AtpI family protein [Desulfobacteraceae bacterium]